MTITLPNLSTCNTKELRALFEATLGTPTMSNNRPWMIKRISGAQTVPAPAPAPAPSVTPEPAAEPPSAAVDQPSVTAEAKPATEVAMPPVGSEIRRTWRGQEIIVTVQADGFLLNGTTYSSLSAAATALCGSNRNGPVFFGLKPRPAKVASAGGAS
ncbi:hypothetical protein LBMAG53_19870 [Planctomycetota bacterium]|nr:hypothetical protein LBMAG53_19870 [Planctomycetota bacterium]